MSSLLRAAPNARAVAEQDWRLRPGIPEDYRNVDHGLAMRSCHGPRQVFVPVLRAGHCYPREHESCWSTGPVTVPLIASGSWRCTPHADARGQWRCRLRGQKRTSTGRRPLTESSKVTKLTSLALSNDCKPNYLPLMLVSLISVVQSARVGQETVKLANTCKSHR
jgi:hypothetical protein